MFPIDRLPPEVVQNVFKNLDVGDLKSIRLVNKQYAALATPPLFTAIQFLGPGQKANFKPTSEFRKLHEAVTAVLPLAGAAEKLIFAPAFYRQGLWNDYRAYVTEQAEEPVDVEEVVMMDDEDENEDESEDENDDENDDGVERFDRRFQALVERRRARPDEERERILQAEEEWAHKRQEQEANMEKIEGSLQELFGRMNRLQEVEIQAWEFHGYRGLDFYSFEIDKSGTSSTTMHHLQTIASCLFKSNRRIQKLYIHAFNPDLVEDSPAMRHVFTGLRHLRLDIYQVEFLLGDSPTKDIIPGLVKHTYSTLERLEIVSGSKWPQLPHRGVHTLNNLFTDTDTGNPLSFPNLRFFRLGSLIVSTASLLDFLAVQPQIRNLEFDYLYLVTPGMGWTSLATRLPKTVQSWEVSGSLGEEPVQGYEPPIAYNWCTKWRHHRDALPASTGWKGEPAGPNRTCFRRTGGLLPDDSTDTRSG